MEVVVPMAQEQDFHFGGNYNSTLMIAPPSPKPFGDPSEYHRYYYSSAPTSPTRAAAMRGEFSSSNAKELDFAFNFTPSAAIAAADELFEGGKIKPWKPNMESQRERGRPLTSISTTSSISRRESRSLSPMRGGGGGEGSKGSRSKKWKLKDLFLFRSASEGSKDTLRKYFIPSNVKNSISDQDSGNRSMRRTHEMHYTASRAAAEEMKKKRTPLPFHRNSLFGYLRFNPAIHSITRRFNRGS